MRNCLPTSSPDVFKGVGDGAVIASLSPSTNPVSTVDLLVEEVHFDLTLVSVHPQGRQALAVNLNDIAALGGSPVLL
jgi:thiamine-monophosphate kinase